MKVPNAETVCLEFTPEIHAKWQKIASCILEVLTESTGGPEEAYIILQSLVRQLEENYGIRGEFITEAKD